MARVNPCKEVIMSKAIYDIVIYSKKYKFVFIPVSGTELLKFLEFPN